MNRLRDLFAGSASLALLAPLVIGSGDGPRAPSLEVAGQTSSRATADIGVVCGLIGPNCLLPNQQVNGGALGVVSDKHHPGGASPAGRAAAERIANNDVPRTLTEVCWWGVYQDRYATPRDCSADPGIFIESFDITIYHNDSNWVPGCPTSVPGDVYVSFADVVFAKSATGNLVPGNLFEFEYTAVLPEPVELDADTCYWIEIQNDTSATVSDTCWWLWTTAPAPPGDNVSAMTASFDANGDGVYAQADVDAFDLALCLNVPLGDTSICDPIPDPGCVDQPGYCGVPHATPGCDDPCCCTLVCEIDQTCCTAAWTLDCAGIAVSEGCAPGGQPVCIATGTDNTAEGYLKICSDPYGSWSDDARYGAGEGDPNWGDEFLPAGSTLQPATFTVGFYVFVSDTHRELLTANDAWKQNVNGEVVDDDSLVSQYDGVTSLEYDDSGDGVSDRLESSFTVAGAGVNLQVDLTQKVTTGGSLPAGVSVMTQTLVINNLDAQEISFELLRHLDGDLPWDDDPDFQLDDSPGTGTNAAPLDRHIYQHEVGSEAQSLTISSDHGDQYYGCINTHRPPASTVTMGYGTDTQTWENYGVPVGWENYIAFVGYDTDGETGDQQNDGSIGLEMPVTIPGLGQETVIVRTTYGATTPADGGDPPPCPCDCEEPPDGTVDVGDFLALLAQWGTAGPCDCEDPPDGAVDVGDFLALLATWGDCP
ncbi:MAG: DUF7901 domain-containing protein [Planctomycetota bacterium]|jgi:hypothetical protein